MDKSCPALTLHVVVIWKQTWQSKNIIIWILNGY